MYNLNQTYEILDRYKDVMDVAEDMEMYNQSKRLLERYNRDKAISQIQKIIGKYESEINDAGFFDNHIVIRRANCESWNDVDVMQTLLYLSVRIPIYACIHSGKEQLAKKLFCELNSVL